MEAVRWMHVVARWALVLIEAAGLLWTASLLLALLCWAAWAVYAAVTRTGSHVKRSMHPRPDDHQTLRGSHRTSK